MPLTSEDWIENTGQQIKGGTYMIRYANGNTDLDRVFAPAQAYTSDITHFIRLDPPPLPRWRPKENEVYQLLNDEGCIQSAVWWDDSPHRERFAIGNCFPSKEAAEASEHYEFAQRMKAKYGGDQ